MRTINVQDKLNNKYKKRNFMLKEIINRRYRLRKKPYYMSREIQKGIKINMIE